jgi:hypothetical protein
LRRCGDIAPGLASAPLKEKRLDRDERDARRHNAERFLAVCPRRPSTREIGHGDWSTPRTKVQAARWGKDVCGWPLWAPCTDGWIVYTLYGN